MSFSLIENYCHLIRWQTKKQWQNTMSLLSKAQNLDSYSPENRPIRKEERMDCSENTKMTGTRKMFSRGGTPELRGELNPSRKGVEKEISGRENSTERQII